MRRKGLAAAAAAARTTTVRRCSNPPRSPPSILPHSSTTCDGIKLHPHRSTTVAASARPLMLLHGEALSSTHRANSSGTRRPDTSQPKMKKQVGTLSLTPCQPHYAAAGTRMTTRKGFAAATKKALTVRCHLPPRLPPPHSFPTAAQRMTATAPSVQRHHSSSSGLIAAAAEHRPRQPAEPVVRADQNHQTPTPSLQQQQDGDDSHSRTVAQQQQDLAAAAGRFRPPTEPSGTTDDDTDTDFDHPPSQQQWYGAHQHHVPRSSTSVSTTTSPKARSRPRAVTAATAAGH